MARVARRWVVVTEPAQASITRLAIRFRLALETEEAGNRVARLDPLEVAGFLAARGETRGWPPPSALSGTRRTPSLRCRSGRRRSASTNGPRTGAGPPASQR